MNGLDGEMRDAARELEDALETRLLLLDHDDDDGREKLKEDVQSFCRKVMELKDEYAKAEELGEEEEEEEDRIDVDDLAQKMVGYSDVLCRMEDELFSRKMKGAKVRVLVGMAGLGKTTLARQVFDDPQASQWFDYSAWVHVGPEYQFTDILKRILDQVDPGNTSTTLTEGDELLWRFHTTVEDRRCLIVLDDVWDDELIPPVRELLQKNNHSREETWYSPFLDSALLVTSRLQNIGTPSKYKWPAEALQHIKTIQLRFMNKDESWDLLRDKVFGEYSTTTCTPELVKAGKKIAENCEGLPLTIVTIADILMSKADETTMTPEYWNQVAEGRNSVFVDAYEKMSKVLLRSYQLLLRNYKEYFLYMGVFPPKCDVPLSKLTLLWVVEQFFESIKAANDIKKFKDKVSTSMEGLMEKSLVLVRKTTFFGKPKTYGLHSAIWHSCVGEAGKNKFFHLFNKYADGLDAKRMRNQRRLCVHNNVLFGIKQVRDSMASISTARSLLCTGPHHPYPVPVCFNRLRLLRVIDALTVRFYEFPAQVVELVLLRYLALTCDGKLPTCISKLSNLQVFIVRRYLNILKLHKKDESSSYLPMEIWDMKQLQHLQVMGDDLPEPRAGVVLPNLGTLMDVNARSFTKGVLQGLPALMKLGIRIELSADDAEPLSISFYNKNNNDNLESIKFVVVNPVFRCSPIVSSLLFPNSLKKLSLNGLGCPWEDINEAVASLPKLYMLKLRCYAFRGAKWETPEKGFPSLQFLLIEDTDLVHWTVGEGSFRMLHCLVLKDCYKLEDIKPGFRYSLNRVEMVDCSPSAVACVKQMQMQAKRSTLQVFVVSSWEDGGKKLKS